MTPAEQATQHFLSGAKYMREAIAEELSKAAACLIVPDRRAAVFAVVDHLRVFPLPDAALVEALYITPESTP